MSRILLTDEFGNPITTANPLPVIAELSTVNIGLVELKDGVTGNVATIAQFHNADNQALPANSYGVNTGGVAQLLNSSSNLDRQRETGQNNTSNLGIATGTQQLKSPISTTLNGAVLANATTATLTATKFTNNGSQAWVQIGTALTFEFGTTNQETVVVTAVNYGTNVVTVYGSGTGNGFKLAHSNSVAVVCGAYNEAVDATAPEGSSGAGIGLQATTLFDSALNSGSGGWEYERSFLGELNGATGKGAAIAAEFEDSAGGPVLATGLASGMRLFPGQNLNGKGRQTGAITASVIGDTNLVFGSAAATKLVLPGHAVQLSGSGTLETVFTTLAWVPGSSATVPLQSPVVNAGQTLAAYDIYAANGPGLNGFLAHGIGIEEEALYNPVDGLYYVERSATQDAMPGANIVAESPALWNGTTFDRAIAANALTDAYNGKGVEAIALSGYNGTTWDRLRTAPANGSGNSNPGNLIVVPHINDQVGNFRQLSSASALSDANNGQLFPGTGLMVYNGTNWDRLHSIPGTLGIQATPNSGTASTAITTATTTVIKATAGVLGTLSNGSNATTGVITVYDNTAGSGKLIWTGTLAAGQVIQFGIPCVTGITIVTAGAQAIVVSFA